MKLEFSRQMFEKYSNIKFHENLSSGSRVVPADAHTDTDRQTDRQDEANCRCSQFCERAYNFIAPMILTMGSDCFVQQSWLTSL